MISAKVNTQSLENTILLIDEPEVGLHPSGARHLLKELIKISTTNIVFFSTHSIFMIDREEINRHLIVKKESGITSIRKAESSNIVDEEVLYNAIGYSVFETLKQQNIIFEGWRDKKLFQTAVKGLQKADESMKSALLTKGTCHAKGVKDIRSVSAFIELANRDCLIISDDDPPAREKQKQYQADRGYGIWKRYSEVGTGINVVTGEDFLKASSFHKPLAAIRKEKATLPALSDGDLCSPSGKVKSIEKWLTDNGVSVEEARNLVSAVKDAVFDKLKPVDIDDSYRTVLEFVANEKNWK